MRKKAIMSTTMQRVRRVRLPLNVWMNCEMGSSGTAASARRRSLVQPIVVWSRASLSQTLSVVSFGTRAMSATTTLSPRLTTAVSAHVSRRDVPGRQGMRARVSAVTLKLKLGP